MLRSLTLTALLVMALPAAALAFDLTGNWTSSFTCISLFEGEKITYKDTPAIAITQNGAAIGMRVTYAGGDFDLYTARANPDVKKPDEKGEIAMIACGTDGLAGNAPNFDEIGRFTVSAKPDKVKASVKGQSIFSDPGVVSPESGRCKWKLTRIDTTDPGIATACPAPVMVRAATGHRARHRR